MTKTSAWLLSITLTLGNMPAAAEEPLDLIAFGSCLRQDEPQPIWRGINRLDPDLFLFMGDNVYADSTDPKEIRAAYDELLAREGYQRLVSRTPVMATWDDHDYGANDAGAGFPAKHASKAVFLEAFNVPPDDPRRDRPGLYHARRFGPEGRRVQVIMLDTRWFRGPLKRRPEGESGPGHYVPYRDPEVTMLGEAQWDWLADQLRKPARIRVIVSSIQVIPHQHGFESWGNLPIERGRLFETIADARAGGVVLLSGDRHLAEISKLPPDRLAVGYPVYEVTSSGMNSAGAGRGEENRFRVTADNVRVDNFGSLRIDWQVDGPVIHLQIRDVDGEVVQSHSLRLEELQPPTG